MRGVANPSKFLNSTIDQMTRFFKGLRIFHTTIVFLQFHPFVAEKLIVKVEKKEQRKI